MSHVFAVVAVAAAGNICAMHKPVLEKIGAHQTTLAAIMIGNGALPRNEHAARAALETAGVMMDRGDGDVTAMTVNFFANYLTRKAFCCLDANGMSAAPVAKVINSTPVVGNHVGPVITEAVRAAAPQIVAGLIVMAVSPAQPVVK